MGGCSVTLQNNVSTDMINPAEQQVESVKSECKSNEIAAIQQETQTQQVNLCQQLFSKYQPVKTEMFPGVFWVGVNDWSIRKFHGYNTDKGSSYNSFLLMDEKPTLIDTVKNPFSEEFIDNLKSIIELPLIKYIIMNHSEPDHSSALPVLYSKTPQATIVTNIKCKENLLIIYPELSLLNPKWLVVDTKSQLNIGKRTLTFVPVPMIYWPCNMFTYCKEDNVLFSNDGFGQHLASAERWADQLKLDTVVRLMMEYNANILGHLPVMLKNILNTVNKMNVKHIFTAHGVCWRGESLTTLLEEYSRFANQTYRKKVTVIFDSMYGSTARAALALSEGVRSTGASVELVDLKSCSLTTVALHMYDSACFAVGSPTLNNTMIPFVERALAYCRGLKLMAGKPCFLFGAYGWAGTQSANDVTEAVTRGGAQVEGAVFQWKLQVNEDTLGKLYEQGTKLGQKALDTGK
ncbi:A-type_flavoprotein 2 [Hexamita inflata]|uniref:A-type flavoprotein 2 n=1 Tax=Hexamita inflata TaxID=28002 RepID=A0AA86P427_9EUKA|nr:A-type flavoprotein 2 [Hexamita inflata]